jgi:hypothetical protein
VIVCLFPEAKTSKEGVAIITASATGREPLQFFGVASSNDDVIGMESINQTAYAMLHIRLPFFLPHALEPSKTEVVFICSLLIREVADFQGYDDPLVHKCRAETRTRPTKARLMSKEV